MATGRGPGSDLSRMMREGASFSGLERNCVYLNTGASPGARGRFANISAVSGLDFPDDGRAVALVDWDRDGDLDLWISNRSAPRLRLMRNDQPGEHHFLALRLEGNGTSTNRDAIGARVEVKLAGDHRPLIKSLRAGEGFLAQSSKWLHFGLGSEDAIAQITVHWPGGGAERFTDISANRRHHLVQGAGMAAEVTLPAPSSPLAPAEQHPLPATTVARIPLVELLPLPRLSYDEFDGTERELPLRNDRVLLVN
ncbi:MAG: CRTAC1 family protein, partial [Akkermansiaceae bacterium]|nr:CRTAC1 family protein [Akkermansiaceae bacterium]